MKAVKIVLHIVSTTTVMYNKLLFRLQLSDSDSLSSRGLKMKRMNKMYCLG